MKVILLRDIAKIGRRNQVVELPDGYAQNQLIPKKWAELATPANLKRINTANAVVSAHHRADDDRFAEALKALTAAPLQVVVKDANAQGHLFKAVHEKDIVAAANDMKIGLTIGDITIPAQIKSLGAHTILLSHSTKKETVTIEVVIK